MKLENSHKVSNYTEADRQLARTAKRSHGIMFYNNKCDLFLMGVYKTSVGVVYMKIEDSISKKPAYKWPPDVKEMTFEDEERMNRSIKKLCDNVFAVKHNTYSHKGTPIKHRLVYNSELMSVEKIEG